MLQKADVLILLDEMDRNGQDVKEDIANLYKAKIISIDTLKKINSYKTLDLINFYEKLRHSYNAKKSKLYKNIMKADEDALEDPKKAITTLTALLNQVFQFKPEDVPSFYRAARITEILEAIQAYATTYDLVPTYNMLHLIKADIIVTEFVNEHRQLK